MGRDRPKKGEIFFFVLNYFNLTRVRKFKNNIKKIQKIKKHHPGFISSRNRSGLAEKQRKKKVFIPFHSYSTGVIKLKKKNSKNYKTSSRLHFKPKRVRKGQKIGKTFFLFQFISTRPELENTKIIGNKIQKIKKHQLGFISGRNGLGQAEKQRKKKLFRSVPTRPKYGNLKKNSKKIQKIKKHHPGSISNRNGMGQAEK